jgi:hypothetical protein
MTDLISLDLATLLLFTMPGFFFLRAMGYKTSSDLTYFMYSMFWGILLMVFIYRYLLSIEKLAQLVENPYAGAVIFSMLAGLVGLGIRSLKPRFLSNF